MNIQWLNSNNVEQYLKDEILKMSEQELKDRFSENLQFGTGGMRSIIGAGMDRMNVVTVRHITLGLARYLKKNNTGEIKVVIGYDSRHFSKEFSEEAARVLASEGINVKLFDRVKPTPLVSFAIRQLNCTAGIMITASHNPKEYNGYKVYNQNGAQLNLSESEMVTKSIDKIKNIIDYQFTEFEEVVEKGIVSYINEDFDQVYLDAISSLPVTQEQKKDIKIVFSASHGTTGELGIKVLKRFGFNNIIEVEEQMKPDPNFSYMESANPEDLVAYDLALEYAKEYDGDIIIITDPDGDRLGIMIRTREGKYIALNGNQTSALIINYLNENEKISENTIIFNTIVSGQLGTEIITKTKANFMQTLVGFKFIAEKIEENKESNFILGYEESYGYLLSDVVRDKDALQALLIVSEMTNFYLNQDKYLDEVLNSLYQKYGYYCDETKSLEFKEQGLRKIEDIMKYYKENDIVDFCGYQVISKVDYMKEKTGLPKSNIIKFNLKDIGWLVFRPSGTEPKIKIYLSIKGSSQLEANEILNEIYSNIVTQISKI